MINLEGVAAIVAVVVALVTFVVEARRAQNLRRAELVKEYTLAFHASAEIEEMFADIDYERLRFDPDAWNGRRPEQTLVRMLDLFNSLGHNWCRGVLKLGDIYGTTLGYAVVITSQNEAVRAYLSTLPAHDEKNATTGLPPFEFFRPLAAALSQPGPRQVRVSREARRFLPQVGSTK